ncbi:MAG: RNA polymerase sigma factor [Deltaproteobacteria bacterium]|nr:RNA polymerase sigma factor [Deltaproteobacteria bacterium]
MSLALLAAMFEPAVIVPPRDRDDDLIARFRDGDPDAFAAIYRAHVDAVYRRLTRILGPVPEREDLTQDVFVTLHRALGSFRGDAALATYIHRIAINTALDYLRARGRRPAAPVDTRFLDTLIAPQATPDVRAEQRERLAHVFACLAKIKPKKRIALLLRVVEGLSFEDIARLVDATPEAVAKRVQHGQRELDALLARTEAS